MRAEQLELFHGSIYVKKNNMIQDRNNMKLCKYLLYNCKRRYFVKLSFINFNTVSFAYIKEMEAINISGTCDNK